MSGRSTAPFLGFGSSPSPTSSTPAASLPSSPSLSLFPYYAVPSSFSGGFPSFAASAPAPAPSSFSGGFASFAAPSSFSGGFASFAASAPAQSSFSGLGSNTASSNSNVSESKDASDASSSADAAAAAKHNTPFQREVEEEALILKVAVTKKNNRVVFVESSNDFVDVVFSFLTLPIGCIVSLLQGKSPALSIGCMNNLYASATNLNARDFVTEACKEMLLHPRTSLEAQCRKLKLKYNEKLETPKCFYFCQNSECRRQGRAKLSEIPNAHCHCCGQLMDQLATLLEEAGNLTCGEEGGVFVKGGSNLFLVTNNMQVMPGLGLLSIELLKKLGITDANELEIQSVAVRPEKILQLLELSIISRTPLTNWILSEQHSSSFTEVQQERSTKTSEEQEESSAETFRECSKTSGSHVLNKVEQESGRETSDHSETNESQKMKLVLFFSKSQNSVLYAECDEDFVNFLFSFLTFPLGSVLKILDGNSQLGSLDNLYRSVTDLNINGQLKSEELKEMLLCPKLAPFFACDNQLLQIEESCHPEYKLWATSNDPKIEWFVQPASTKPKLFTFGESIDLLSVSNPRSPTGESKQGQGFVEGPAKFMVTDDLTVTLFSPTESISLIGKSNVPIADIDAISVDFGVEEAKCLLGAALISRTALTDVFILMQAKNLVRAALISKTTLTDIVKEKTSSKIFHVHIDECEDW